MTGQCQWKARDTKVSTVIASISGEYVPVPDGAGQKGTASVLHSGGDEVKLLTVGVALARGWRD